MKYKKSRIDKYFVRILNPGFKWEFIPRIVRKERFRYSGLAAFLIFLTVIWTYSCLISTSESIADGYFKPLPNIIQNQKLSAAAFDKYELKKFEEAIVEFGKLEGEEYALLYSGVSYLALKKYSKAIQTLNSFKTNDEGMPVETYRKWYLGLAYLRRGETGKAKALFYNLSGYINPVQNKSQEILREINKN